VVIGVESEVASTDESEEGLEEYLDTELLLGLAEADWEEGLDADSLLSVRGTGFEGDLEKDDSSGLSEGNPLLLDPLGNSSAARSRILLNGPEGDSSAAMSESTLQQVAILTHATQYPRKIYAGRVLLLPRIMEFIED
jgi:hypothetical protein